MGSTYLTNPLVFLITVIFDLFLFAVLLRFLFQWLRVDFYNPLSQTIVKVTSPFVNPLRKIIPGIAGLDMASLLLAFIIAAAKSALLYKLQGYGLSANAILVSSLIEVITAILNIFLFAIFIQVILSWVAPGQHNPITLMIAQLTGPILAPIRRVMPDLGGLDLSPMVALVGIQIAKMLIIPPLIHLAN